MKKFSKVLAMVLVMFTLIAVNKAGATTVEELDLPNAEAEVAANIAATKERLEKEAVTIDELAVPMGEAPKTDIDTAPETTPSPTPDFVGEKQEQPDKVEPTPEPNVVPETTPEAQPTEEVIPESETINPVVVEPEPEPELVMLEQLIDLDFDVNGDILATYTAGDPNSEVGPAICAKIIGKWFPNGDIAMYNSAENALGPAIYMMEEEDSTIVSLGGIDVRYDKLSEEGAKIILRLIGQLTNEQLDSYVFGRGVQYSITAADSESVTVVREGDIVQVTMPNTTELTFVDFLALVYGLQAIK